MMQTRPRTRTRRRTYLVLPLLLVTVLAGCAPASAADTEWSLIAEGDIVAIDSNTGVYVSGRIGMYRGSIDSSGVIDYQYARVLSTGGVREDLISSTYNRFEYGTRTYPGSHVVTLFEDADADGSDARIEIFRCNGNGHQCTMPDGARMGESTLRVDVHVPAGSVVQSFGDAPPTPESDNPEPTEETDTP